MTYRNQHWLSRLGQLGDKAEDAFAAWSDTNGISYLRYGLNRPPIYVPNLPAFIRFTPDFLLADRLVECIGCGRDQILKMKVEKYVSLKQWDTLFPVWLFCWNSHKKQYAYLPLAGARDWVDNALTGLSHFSEGNAYLAWPAELAEWTDA